jgi:hypothetical protein
MKKAFVGFRRKLLEAAITAAEHKVLASQRFLDDVSVPAG